MFRVIFNHIKEKSTQSKSLKCYTSDYKNSEMTYRISGNFGAMEILALLADDKNTLN